jgi:hypothetical protein
MGDWDILRSERLSRGGTGISTLRLALLFGSAAVALALIATPMLDRNTRLRVSEATFTDGLDPISTGSTPRHGSRYVLRRSVLQTTPSAVCVIRADGAASGDC